MSNSSSLICPSRFQSARKSAKKARHPEHVIPRSWMQSWARPELFLAQTTVSISINCASSYCTVTFLCTFVEKQPISTFFGRIIGRCNILIWFLRYTMFCVFGLYCSKFWGICIGTHKDQIKVLRYIWIAILKWYFKTTIVEIVMWYFLKLWFWNKLILSIKI